MTEAMTDTGSTKDQWLRKQFNWQDVEHLINEGKILSLVYDTETTDLNTDFAALTQFSGKIVDVQGNIIDEMKLEIQVPEDVAISPQAAIVTQSHPEELYSKDRTPPHVAAAKMIHFFRNPYRALWDKLDDAEHKIEVNRTQGGEEARVYTISSPDGKHHADIRIHQAGKLLSIRYPDKVDYLCDALEQMKNTSTLAEAIAGMVELEVRDIYDVEGQAFDRKALEQAIRRYDGSRIGALLEDLTEKLGDHCPPELHHVPTESQLPDDATTYRDRDGTRWKSFAAPAMTNGHNIINFDDRMLWQAFHRVLSDDIFITHIKNYQRFRVDTFHLARLVALLDQEGENGFKAGEKTNKETGQPYESFSLSELMEANTREANPERGIDEGVRMPDGSKYDRNLAHQDAAYDVDATIALKAYLRKRAPDVVRLVEQHTDFEKFKHFLIAGDGVQTHPLRAFVRKGFPEGAQLNIGVCAAIDEEIKEMRKAIMVRTDTDQKLEDFAYRINGKRKKLVDMTAEELASMLAKQEGRPDALFEVINMRKNPPVVPAQMAFERGIGGDPEQHEANRRFVLANKGFCDRLLEAYRMNHQALPDFREKPNPQAEEHLFTRIAEAKPYEVDVDGKKILVPECVRFEHMRALGSNNKKAKGSNRHYDETLYRTIKPHMIEAETRLETLHDFVSRLHKVNDGIKESLETKKLPLPVYDTSQEAEEVQPYETESWKFKLLPPPDKPFLPKKYDRVPDPDKPGKKKNVPHEVTQAELEWLTENAVEYLWKLRAEFMYEFLDTTNRYTVQDRYGHDMDWKMLHKMKPANLADRLRSGEYRIHMEELGNAGWSTELVARMFRDAGRMEWVKDYLSQQGRENEAQEWDRWEEYFKAHRALRFHGAPHVDADAQECMSCTKGLKEVARLRQNLREGDIRATDEEWGAWDIFMRNQANAEHVLDEYEALARRQLDENPLTDAHKTLLGYDPQTGMPMDYAPHQIAADAHTLTIDVPDRMLEAPLSHHDVAGKMVMLSLTDKQHDALKNAPAGTIVKLRSAQMGDEYLAVKPVMLSSDVIRPDAYFHEVYAQAATRYEDSGMTPPPAEQLVPLAIEALERIESDITPQVQALKIPRKEDFEALVSPVLGLRDEKLTGLVIRHEAQTPIVGEVRLQEMQGDAKKGGLRESGREVSTTITQVRTMTLKEAKARIKDGGFTAEEARHYGFAGLEEMQSKLTAMFTANERRADRDDNLIHFVDIEPADKANMCWHNPAKRPMVELVKNDGPEDKPDPTLVKGAPAINRAPKPGQQRA